ncbi:hypothetical protein HHK36_028906 [Tetracentron sinense]|uniref:LIM zinc-binding domain-containing protein n=1 Tax=Tetracentron sinense TaxID=13715 RepID=A0A834YI85_TETSI|nr:hypothetical protein HHK36_028906 [Tetracentron sinense]
MAFSGTLQKCNACDKTVYVVDLLSADGIAYHKSCFKCSHCRGTLVSRTPSRLCSMFSGTQDKCSTCHKTAYPLEKVTVEGEYYHKSCFKCSHGGCSLTPSSYAALDGILYCKHHFAQLFKEKGNYNHLIKTASIRKNAAPLPLLVPVVPAPEPELEQTQEQTLLMGFWLSGEAHPEAAVGVGDGVTVNTEAFERAVSAIAKLGKRGGGQLYLLPTMV